MVQAKAEVQLSSIQKQIFPLLTFLVGRLFLLSLSAYHYIAPSNANSTKQCLLGIGMLRGMTRKTLS